MITNGVVLLNMGGPKSESEVKPFLKAMFDDPDLIRMPAKKLLAPMIIGLRAPVARRRYAKIEGGSPLLSISLEQADLLQRCLNRDGDGEFRVRVGMRYTSPTIEEAISELEDLGCQRLFCLSMYPQYCRATTGSALAELSRVLERRQTSFDVKIIDRYYDHPGYLDAVADTIRDEGFEGDDRPFLLFSAHGIPAKMVEEGDPYVEETTSSVRGVVERLGLKPGEYQLAYQSRVGPMSWVGPSTEKALGDAAASGINSLLFVPISFTADNLETLYDIEIVLAEKARSLGIGRVSRANALNASGKFIESLALMVREASGEH